MVDVSMADGALSWLAMVAGAYFADGEVPHRGELPLAGSLICYRPYECADGWVSLGALEPKFWQAWCRGVGREDLIGAQFERPGSERRTARSRRSSRARTRAQWEAFAREHDCCLEPVLELDEALDSELVTRARDGRRDRASPVPSGRSASWGSRSSSTAPRATTPACPGRRSASTPRRCCAPPATPRRRSPSCSPAGAAAGPAETQQRRDAAGVSAAGMSAARASTEQAAPERGNGAAASGRC